MDSYFEEACEGDQLIFAIPPHPLGVKPLGNVYTGGSNAKQRTGSLALLNDEIISSILELLDGFSLTTTGKTCKFLYAFTSLDDIWKSLFLEWVLGSLA